MTGGAAAAPLRNAASPHHKEAFSELLFTSQPQESFAASRIREPFAIQDREAR
jgi:hypothetical protein